MRVATAENRVSARSSDRREWIARARSVRIEDEIERRGIKLLGRGPERCGPCPRCGGTDRFAINLRKQVWNCRGCKRGGNITELVQHLDGCSFRDAVARLTGEALETCDAAGDRKRDSKTNQRPYERRAANAEAYERQQHKKAAWLWSQRRPIGGTVVEKYLSEVRGYSGPAPSTLGFLPPSIAEHHPAMIAAFGIPDEPEPGILGELRNVGSIHLTLLKPDGSGKAELARPKLIIGRPLGWPIVLAPPNDLLGLAITEGIEDALTAHQVTGLGAWVAGSGGFMPALGERVPDYFEAVTIFAHADQTGQPGAQTLADALELRGLEVRIEGLGA
jgi:hypothetical protein